MFFGLGCGCLNFPPFFEGFLLDCDFILENDGSDS